MEALLILIGAACISYLIFKSDDTDESELSSRNRYQDDDDDHLGMSMN